MPTNPTDEQLAQHRAARATCDHADMAWRWAAVTFESDDRLYVPGTCPDCGRAFRRYFESVGVTLPNGEAVDVGGA